MCKPSDNFIAETMLKDLGKAFGGAGSTTAGAAVASRFLRDNGISTGGFTLTDGSGLSYKDRLTPQSLVRLLRVMSERLDFDSYWSSLAVAGVDGTLVSRMRGTLASANLHGKTGTLSTSSCLSGYVLSADGDGLVFSVLMSGAGLNTWAARGAQDAIGAALAASVD
jgi:serine-type D-Ala-D-Ala carboxypeptidase/endopeptidase (penicillin-binding protein 4)